ncbi:MAG: AAA family ATPase [Spirochaetota bacterium]
MKHLSAVFVSGPPASGKTTLARGLARRLNMSFIDLDTLSEPFLRPYLLRLPGYKDSQEYRDSMRDREYEALMRLVRDNLEVGIGCVAVAPFSKERSSAGFPQSYWTGLRAAGAEAMPKPEPGMAVLSVGVVIRIDPEQQLRNLQARGATRDIKKIERWDEYSRPGAGRITADEDSWAVDVKITVEYEDLKTNFAGQIERIAASINQSVQKPE